MSVAASALGASSLTRYASDLMTPPSRFGILAALFHTLEFPNVQG